MKNFTLTMLFAGLMVTMASAQLQTPSPSPLGKVEQRIGLTDVSVEYSRPSKKGRVVYGELVPYGEVWRTGANAATKVTFSDDVWCNGKEVKKGSYAMLTKPDKKSWEVMLYPYTGGNWSGYLESGVTPVSFTTESIMMPNATTVETFMIGFDGLTNHEGTMYLLWETTFIPIVIKTKTDETTEASIAKVLAGPSAGEYFQAANYYYAEKKDLKKALEWINMSIDKGNDRYWVLRTKSLIQADLGDKKGAIETAMKSLDAAKAGNDAHYIRLNEASIAEWKKS